MAQKTNVRITFDIPTNYHKQLTMLADQYDKNMQEMFVELFERGLETYPCPLDHTPNAVTQKALANIEAGKRLGKVATIDELFKKLRK